MSVFSSLIRFYHLKNEYQKKWHSSFIIKMTPSFGVGYGNSLRLAVLKRSHPDYTLEHTVEGGLASEPALLRKRLERKTGELTLLYAPLHFVHPVGVDKRRPIDRHPCVKKPRQFHIGGLKVFRHLFYGKLHVGVRFLLVHIDKELIHQFLVPGSVRQRFLGIFLNITHRRENFPFLPHPSLELPYLKEKECEKDNYK